MATSRDKEQVKSRQQCRNTQPLHSTAILHSTLGAAPVPKQIAVKTMSCQNTFTVFFFK